MENMRRPKTARCQLEILTLSSGSWETEVVPIFVNEAAYYNSESGAGIGIAMIKELLIDYD